MVIHSGPPAPEKPATVSGMSSSELAKIGGITPAELILSGRCVVSPPNILLPVWRLGYCTGTRRWARSTKTMKAMTMTDMTSRKMIKAADSAPVRPSSRVLTNANGRLATMPEKMISEMPLPTPRWVICSPSHIRNMVPPVSVITVVRRKKRPGLMTAEPAGPDMPSSPTARP